MKEYVRGKKTDLDEKATVRFETMPGQQGQMDRGFLKIIVSKKTDKKSRYIVFCLFLDMHECGT